ncbi:MAG: carboxypeptidase-like regulatory domain-containing protein [Sphingobacterium sp.]
MESKKIWCAICVLLTMTSCKKDQNTGASEKGYAQGKVIDTQGKPIANAEIAVENTLVGTYESYYGKTDAGGNYKIAIGKVGTYHTSAYINVNYNNLTYHLPMHPDNDDVFSNAGAVRNFQWKLSGKMPDQGYYGSNIEITGELGEDVPDDHNIEYTLTPVGKRIDGSDGTILKLHTGLPNTPSYGKLLDIPIARYTVTAKYIKDGISKSLKLKSTLGSDTYQPSVTIDFPEDWYLGVALTYKR